MAERLSRVLQVRGEWEQYGLALLAMLVYNMSKAVLHRTEGELVGQALLCASSFWNAMVNRRRTNGGVNCLRPKVYKLYLPGPIPSMLGAL
jgi:hypothetical protein